MYYLQNSLWGKKKQTNQKTTNNKTKKKKETDLKTDFKKDLHLNDVLWKWTPSHLEVTCTEKGCKETVREMSSNTDHRIYSMYRSSYFCWKEARYCLYKLTGIKQRLSYTCEDCSSRACINLHSPSLLLIFFFKKQTH